MAWLTSNKIIPLLHLSSNAYKSLDPFSILACKPILEHYFVGVKIIFLVLERKYGYLWFECSSSDSPTTSCKTWSSKEIMGASDFECSPKSSDGLTMEKVRNEDIVCLTLIATIILNLPIDNQIFKECPIFYHNF